MPDLRWNERGLLPAVVQAAGSGEVLMVGWVNEEALRRTLREGGAWFWSRSRGELWQKGATSGNTMRVREVLVDCDEDVVLYRGEPAGPICHTGARSCFYRRLTLGEDGLVHAEPVAESAEPASPAPADAPPIASALSEHAAPPPVPAAPETSAATGPPGEPGEVAAPPDPSMAPGPAIIDEVFEVIRERQRTLPENSYTAYLFRSGVDKIGKKIGEESAEVIIAAKNGLPDPIALETADLIYHALVMLAATGVEPAQVWAELAKRRR